MLRDSVEVISMAPMHEAAARLALRVACIVAALVGANTVASADDSRPGAAPTARTPSPAPYSEPADDRPPVLDNHLQAVPLLGPTYVAAETKYTWLAGGGGLLVGGQTGWIVDPHLRLGVGGYGLAVGPSIGAADGRATSLQLAYGGLRVAYALRPGDLVHLSLATLVGIGSVGTTTQDPRLPELQALGSPILFAMEPEVEVEMNLSRSVHLAATASYRYLANPELPRLDSGAVSGVGGGLALEVGSF
jgi:hypothetical protein